MGEKIELSQRCTQYGHVENPKQHFLPRSIIAFCCNYHFSPFFCLVVWLGAGR